MRLSIDLGRWTAAKAVLAVAGLLAIGGVVGSALAVSPINSGPAIKWAGGVPVIRGVLSSGEVLGVYTVPAGRNFMLTDVLVSNFSSANLGAISLYAGAADCASLPVANLKLDSLVVPAGDTKVVPLNTGFGYTAGQTVCVTAAVGPSTTLIVNVRGYLFTAAPAS